MASPKRSYFSQNQLVMDPAIGGYRPRAPKPEWTGVVATEHGVVTEQPPRSSSRASSRGSVARPLAPLSPEVVDATSPGLTGASGGAGPGGVLGTWLTDLLRLTQPSAGSGASSTRRMRGSGPLGCALPPLSDPFWRRADLAVQVRTVLATLQRERALLVAQLRAHRGALQQRAALEATAAHAPAPGVDAAALQKALDSQAALAREREAKLQAEIDAVMLAGVEALEAKNLSSLEVERLTKQVRPPAVEWRGM